jgi:uncharacterized membrane protein
MGSALLAVLATFGLSLIPGLELRAGIPTGMTMGLSAGIATGVAVLGNLLQIPIEIWAVSLAYQRFSRMPRVQRWLARTEGGAGRHAPLIRRWGWMGLAVFVLLPLPATGVWGGVVLARLLGLAGGPLWLGLSVGVAVSGALFGLVSHGAMTAVRFFW